MKDSTNFFLKKQDYLKGIQHRVRLGASHYLQLSFNPEKFPLISQKMEQTFALDHSSSQRNRQKNINFKPVADGFYFFDGSQVHLTILFTLPDSFKESPNFKKDFSSQTQYLNESYTLDRKENFHSIYDKKNRLTIYSSGYPVYVLNCMELPERLSRSGASHQWVWRLHSDFRKGKLEKLLFILEKARNLPKSSKEKELPKLISKLDHELFLLNKLCPFWGVQDDVTSIRRKFKKRVSRSFVPYEVDLFHPEYKGFYISKVTKPLFIKKIKALSNG